MATRRVKVRAHSTKNGTQRRAHNRTIRVPDRKSTTTGALRKKAGDSAEGLSYYTGLLGRAIKDKVKSATERHEARDALEPRDDHDLHRESGPVVHPALTELAEAVHDYETAEEFAEAHRQAHLIDLSDYDKHRYGRIWAGWGVEEHGNGDIIAQNAKELTDEYGPGGANHREFLDGTVPRIVSEEDQVTLYRATIKGQEEIQPGDFVTLNRAYAEGHLETVLEGQQNEEAHLIQITVPAKDVVSPDCYWDEWIYSPQEIRETYTSLTDFYTKIKGAEGGAELAAHHGVETDDLTEKLERTS